MEAKAKMTVTVTVAMRVLAKETLQMRVRVASSTSGMVTGGCIVGDDGSDDGGRAQAGCGVMEREDEVTDNGESKKAAEDKDETMSNAKAEGEVDGKDDDES